MLNQKSRESRGVCRDWFTGHRAGLARRAQFYQLAAQCVEFDHVVYVCPIWTNHQKHAQYHLCSLHEATTLVYKTLQYFCQNEASIRGKVPNLPKSLSSLMLMWPRKNSVGFFFFAVGPAEAWWLINTNGLHFYQPAKLFDTGCWKLSLCGAPQITFVHCSPIHQEFWKYCEGECNEDYKLGGNLFYQPIVLVSCARPCSVTVWNSINTTTFTCSD